jgi:uncharacterized protein (DUF302 family)
MESVALQVHDALRESKLTTAERLGVLETVKHAITTSKAEGFPVVHLVDNGVFEKMVAEAKKDAEETIRMLKAKAKAARK